MADDIKLPPRLGAVIATAFILAACEIKTEFGVIDSEHHVPVRIMCPGHIEFDGFRDIDGVTDQHGNRVAGWTKCVLVVRGPRAKKPEGFGVSND